MWGLIMILLLIKKERYLMKIVNAMEAFSETMILVRN